MEPALPFVVENQLQKSHESSTTLDLGSSHTSVGKTTLLLDRRADRK